MSLSMTRKKIPPTTLKHCDLIDEFYFKLDTSGTFLKSYTHSTHVYHDTAPMIIYWRHSYSIYSIIIKSIDQLTFQLIFNKITGNKICAVKFSHLSFVLCEWKNIGKLIERFRWKYWIIVCMLQQLMKNSCFTFRYYSCFLNSRKKHLQWFSSVVLPCFVQETGFFLKCVINWMHCFLQFTINKPSFLCLFRLGKQGITMDIS